MDNILKIIEDRKSTRALFNPKKQVSSDDIKKIIEAAKWAPTAHNMQNFEIIVVDDKKVLDNLAKIKSTTSEDFIRENFMQLSQSEEELKRKKVGILGSQFPPSWRDASKIDAAVKGLKPSPLAYTIKDSPSVLIVLYDSRKHAPASEGDILGFLSLGCVMQNMWLVAESLGIGFQIMSAFSSEEISTQIKSTLSIPNYMEIGFAIRLGYPVEQNKYLRVRRDTNDFTHHNKYGDKKY
jgi:nitroreductase